MATVEPPQADHPLMKFVGLPSFILSPRVAWASREAVQSLADQLVDNVEGFWNGMPMNIVADVW
jgi:glycerate dehydrogenase